MQIIQRAYQQFSAIAGTQGFIRNISTPSPGDPVASITDNVLSPVIFAVQAMAESTDPSRIIKTTGPITLKHWARQSKEGSLSARFRHLA